ncbi:hypothetical protein AYI68_g790 [Smittium mucronatum]|uniref:Uncharacterized protein n=1 Tax=Smittium mucronatum TaxID=133383 RepID=A0A1R0H782_9FUNG|nr:hypothetical protein AYI68_g790 [Smittium mucronatum]
MDSYSVKNLWVQEPNRIYPPIEKSLLLSEKSHENLKIRNLSRKLIPKRKNKDHELLEDVTYLVNDTCTSKNHVL